MPLFYQQRAVARLFGLLLAVLVFTAGTALAGPPAQSGENASAASPLRVTLLLEHDGGQPWTDLLRAGLAKAERDFPLRTKVLVAPPESDQQETFRQAARESDLVLVASDRLHEILRNNAANFRKTMFGCIDAGIRAPNIMSVTFADEQAAYLAGAAAAMLTGRTGLPGINRDKTVGWLSGEDTPALLLANLIFGGYSNSKLFLNVREKLSLCYYASSGYHRSKGIITVSSGIEAQNYEVARREIAAQLEAVQNGDFEPWELEGARSCMLSSLRSREDSAGRLEEYYLGQAATGLWEDTDALIAQLEAVTPERVAEAARSIRLDTVYFLTGKEGAAQ